MLYSGRNQEGGLCIGLCDGVSIIVIIVIMMVLVIDIVHFLLVYSDESANVQSGLQIRM